MNQNREHKYDDILFLSHHISKKHPQMSLLNRAAQFSPFAALTGHAAAIQETARLTTPFIELDEDKMELLDEQLRLIKENLGQKPEIEVIYFQPDGKKGGGAYVAFHGQVQKIDEYSRQLLFTDGTAIRIEYLYSIEGELFRDTAV